MTLSADIIAAYHRSGLTQEKLAQRVGVSRTTVSDWLTGKSTPRGRNVSRLRQALGLERPAPRLAPPSGLIEVPHYRIDHGRLTRTAEMQTLDAAMAHGMPTDHLGTVFIPPGWDAMIRFARPGHRMLVEIYEPPLSLSQALKGEFLVDGVYLVSFHGGLLLRRLQELPGRVVAVLSDNEAYRDVELHPEAGDEMTLHARALSAEGPV